MLPLVKQLCGHVTELTVTSSVSEDSTSNAQAALVSLRLICRSIGFQHREPFVEVTLGPGTLLRRSEFCF